MLIGKSISVVVLFFISDVYLLCVSRTKYSPVEQTRKDAASNVKTQANRLRVNRWIKLISSNNMKRHSINDEETERGIAARLEIARKIIIYEKWEYVQILMNGSRLGEFKYGMKINDCILRYLDNDNIDETIREVLNNVQVRQTEDQRRILNFVMIDYANRINETMTKLNDIDTEQYNAILRHFSRWLLLPVTDGDIEPNGFDNVAMIRCSQENSNHLQHSWKRFCNTCSIYTSEWKSSGQFFSMLGKISPSTSSELFPNVKYGLNGRELRLSITQWIPYAIKVTSGNTTTFTGVCPRIIQLLAKTYNFTYDFKEPADGQWGQVENGTWTGQIGDVHRKVADMTGSVLGKDLHRVEVADFAVTLRFSPYAIVYLRSSEEKPLVALLRQFEVDVYICGICVVLGIFCLFLFHEYSWHKLRGRSFLNLTKGLQITGKIILLMTSVTLRQGIPKSPHQSSDRILLATLWVFTIIITSIYCGNLIAFRAVPKDTRTFSTLSEMLDQKDMVIGFEGKSMLENLLKQTEDAELNMLWQRVSGARASDESVTSTNQSEHVKRLYSDRNYAYISQLMILPSVTKQDCKILTLDQTFLSSPYSFAFPKNSPLAKLFDKTLLDLIETGILDRMIEESVPNKQCLDEMKQAKAMFLTDYLSAFIAIGVAVVLSTVVLVFEILFASDTIR